MDKPLIRIAKAKDIDDLVKLGYALHQTEKTFEPLLSFSKKEGRDRYKKQINHPNTLFLVVEKDQQVLGYLYAHIGKIDYLADTPHNCEIEAIFLKPEIRGLGLSRDLIKKCIDWGKNKKVNRFTAGIYHDNDISKSSFQASGFRQYHTTYLLEN